MMSPPQAAAVIVAAGRGERLGATIPKAFVAVAGVPMLLHAARRVAMSPEVGRIVVVVGASDVDRARMLLMQHGVRNVTAVVPGGADRQDPALAGAAHRGEAPVGGGHAGGSPLVP